MVLLMYAPLISYVFNKKTKNKGAGDAACSAFNAVAAEVDSWYLQVFTPTPQTSPRPRGIKKTQEKWETV